MRTVVSNRAVEPEPKQFWMAEAGVGAKNFQMVEREPEAWISVSQRLLWGKRVVQTLQGFQLLTDQIILEPEPEI